MIRQILAEGTDLEVLVELGHNSWVYLNYPGILRLYQGLRGQNNGKQMPFSYQFDARPIIKATPGHSVSEAVASKEMCDSFVSNFLSTYLRKSIHSTFEDLLQLESQDVLDPHGANRLTEAAVERTLSGASKNGLGEIISRHYEIPLHNQFFYTFNGPDDLCNYLANNELNPSASRGLFGEIDIVLQTESGYHLLEVKSTTKENGPVKVAAKKQLKKYAVFLNNNFAEKFQYSSMVVNLSEHQVILNIYDEGFKKSKETVHKLPNKWATS